jgi:hypothetical protein
MGMMMYSLVKLAAGSYDILLDGRTIGAVVRGGTWHNPVWIAELLDDLPPPGRPSPFKEVEHEFLSLREIRMWLGNAAVS